MSTKRKGTECERPSSKHFKSETAELNPSVSPASNQVKKQEAIEIDEVRDDIVDLDRARKQTRLNFAKKSTKNREKTGAYPILISKVTMPDDDVESGDPGDGPSSNDQYLLANFTGVIRAVLENQAFDYLFNKSDRDTVDEFFALTRNSLA